MSDSTDLPRRTEAQSKLEQLRADYARALPEKVGQIRALWESLEHAPWNPQVFTELQRLVHNLAGSAGSFGFPAVGERARALEKTMNNCSQGGPDSDLRGRIGVAVADLQRQSRESSEAPTSTQGPAVSPPGRTDTLWMLSEDPGQPPALALALQQHGYRVRLFERFQSLQAALEGDLPAAVIVDGAASGSEEADTAGGLGAIKTAMTPGKGQFLPPPLVVLCDQGDLARRVQALRAGADAYLDKPVEPAVVLAQLDALIHDPEEPYRVLLVDDDQRLTTYYQRVMGDAGLRVRVVNHSLEVMEPLWELEPEVILLDLHMPECDGIELARVIRQEPAFLTVPIVFLSADADPEKQVNVLRRGANDYLVKPVETETLLGTVIRWAHQARGVARQLAHREAWE